MKKKVVICNTCKYCIDKKCTHKSNKQVIVIGRIETEVIYKEKANKEKCNVWANAEL